MKYLIRNPADIVENLTELARENEMLRFTLECLAHLKPSYRQDVLDKLKTRKKGRPNRSAGRHEQMAGLELIIQDYRSKVEESLEKSKVSEKDVIVWLVKNNIIGPWKSYITNNPADDTVLDNKLLGTVPDNKQRSKFNDLTRYVKFVQDTLSDYRRSKRLSPKTP